MPPNNGTANAIETIIRLRLELKTCEYGQYKRRVGIVSACLVDDDGNEISNEYRTYCRREVYDIIFHMGVYSEVYYKAIHINQLQTEVKVDYPILTNKWRKPCQTIQNTTQY